MSGERIVNRANGSRPSGLQKGRWMRWTRCRSSCAGGGVRPPGSGHHRGEPTWAYEGLATGTRWPGTRVLAIWVGCQTEERVLHILTVFRGREDVCAAERLGQPREVCDV